ncbi:MAG: hypothetical protein JSV17_01265 [Candidatus Aminicenantes bacterium]|nr:MAG: hypothetical protein JSV17_01265 [Candidatus Aminicenantes bacterium]
MRNSHSSICFVVCMILILGSLLPHTAQAVQTKSHDFLKNFTWREIGPANPGGRITDIEGVESNPYIIYAGAATGGIWKTTNAGTTWEPIFDDQPNASIGDLAVSLSNPDIIYVGTGESNNRNSSPWGSGMFKSIDAGKTWEFVGLKETHHIGRVLIHPKNPDIVYVAALGHLWGTNEERGVYKTTDGGQNWQKVLYLDDRTGVTDIAMDAQDSEILYVAAHERLRDRFDAGDPEDQWGPKAGIYITLDGGQNWTKASKGLPTEEMGRIGLNAAPGKPGTVYALVSTQQTRSYRRGEEPQEETLDVNKGGIFKSTDYGKTWTHMNMHNNRPSYYSQIRVDPNDENVIWTCGSPLAYSEDGGKTLIIGPEVQSNTHIDYHALWIDPNNSDHVLVGGDGGINITYDRGKNWDIITQIGLAQFYAITADMRKPYYVYGGLQDNGNWGGPSRSRRGSGIVNNDWFPLSNADGFVCQIDPTDYETVYYETQNGYLTRLDLRNWGRAWIRPQPPRDKEGEEMEEYRFDWNSPLIISPHNPHTLYFGGNKLFKSVSRGDSWQVISPDLTADPESRYSAIVSVDESPLKPGLIWAGTSDGNVQLTQDDGATWTLLNDKMTGAPKSYWVKRVEASNHVLGRAYVVFDGHRHDDQDPYIFVTENFGKTWKKITSGLPEGSVYVVREDYKNPDLLFAGTEFAVYISLDRGETWERFMNGLPTVPVHDLFIHPRDFDLIAGTHGRGAWIVDNITPLQQLSPEMNEKDVYLYNIRSEVQWARTYEWSWVADKRFKRSNPPTGSMIYYHLKSEMPEPVKIAIMDITGTVVRNLEGPKNAGLHKVLWDFRKNPPQEQEGGSNQSMQRRFRRPAPMVGPGEYLVQLSAGDKVVNTKLVIEKDNPGYLGR